MSQTTVTRHYSIRKRNVNHVEVSKLPQNIVSKDSEVNTSAKKGGKNVKTTSISKTKKEFANSKRSVVPFAIDKKSKGKQSTLSNFFTTESDKLKTEKTKNGCVSQQLDLETAISEIHCRSPKRNLPSPPDEGTPSKKKHFEESVASENEVHSIGKPKETARRKLQLDSLSRKPRTVHSPNAKLVSGNPKNNLIQIEKSVFSEKEALTTDKQPKEFVRRKLQLDSLSSKSRTVVQSSNAKLVSANSKKDLRIEESLASEKEAQTIDKPKETARKKLQLNSLSSKSRTVIQSPNAKLVSASPRKNLLRTPDKLDALIDQSRSKLVLSPKLDELKRALQLFSEKTSKPKELQSSPYRSKAITSSPKSIEKKPVLPQVSTDSLVLPYKYKVLSEMFCSMDALVGTLNNRKEKITFNNVKEGVQKIMKRNFSEKYLGQIVTVFPSAYNLSREKASYISKKNNSDYQLVITPNLNANEDSNKKTAAFQPMNPSCLTSRTNEFNRNLLELVKKHHQDFLTKINFAPVSVDSIRHWHPKFPVDSVPDIPVTQLPESPEMKIYTAKDVLNKFKGSIQNRVEKALQSVADETEKSGVTLELKEISSPKPEKKELRGISVDLLEKIRAKESEKLLKTMTQSPAEAKKLSMLERVPKIVEIVSFYFISERKTALPVDAVVENIIHSFNSLSTPDDVKEHLKLIAEKFPSWLSFIHIPKGVYITVNKRTNINEMLDNARLH